LLRLVILIVRICRLLNLLRLRDLFILFELRLVRFVIHLCLGWLFRTEQFDMRIELAVRSVRLCGSLGTMMFVSTAST
jgi:hypothetical protein